MTRYEKLDVDYQLFVVTQFHIHLIVAVYCGHFTHPHPPHPHCTSRYPNDVFTLGESEPEDDTALKGYKYILAMRNYSDVTIHYAILFIDTSIMLDKTKLIL